MVLWIDAMPTEFQRSMDLTLAGTLNTFSFKDDILIVTHGIEKKHWNSQGGTAEIERSKHRS